jgi:nitrite reductase/ring-hydroxylating ferredoxin subunit
MAVALDWMGGRKARPAADRLVALGILAAVPTAATGAANWSEFNDEKPRRVGVVHAASNSVALLLFSASWWSRKRGRRWRGKTYALAGTGAMTVGGWLGGHLSYGLGIGVDRTAFQPVDQATEWTDTVALDALTDAKPSLASVAGVDVVLVRDGSFVHALADTCNHMGGPLHEGTVDADAGCITCPWHGSTFRTIDGDVVRSPAVSPQPRFETRVLGGIVQVRSRTSRSSSKEAPA